MRYTITGLRRYLIAAILFGVLGIIFSIRDITILNEGKQSLTIVFSIGMVILAALLYRMYKIGKKTGVDILGEQKYNEFGEVVANNLQLDNSEKEKSLGPKNKKLLQLYVGYMFSWLGAGFAHIGFIADITVAAILGSLFFVLAFPLLITSLRYYFNPTEKNKRAVNKAEKFLVIVAIIAGVSPLFVLIAGLYVSGYYAAFFIIISIIILVASLIIRAQLKKRKRKSENLKHSKMQVAESEKPKE